MDKDEFKVPGKGEIIQDLEASDAQALAELQVTVEKEEAAAKEGAPPEEGKVESPQVEKETPAPPESKVAEEKYPEDEIKPRPHARQETHRDFDALKEIAKKERTEKEGLAKSLREASEKLASLETDFKTKAITPEIEAQLKEYKDLRSTLFAEQEVGSQYAERLQSVDSRAMGILAASAGPNGIKPDLQEFIVGRGGIIAMSCSVRQMPAGKYADKTEQEFVEDVLLPLVPTMQRDRLQRVIGAGMDLRDEMQEKIRAAKESAPQLQAQKQKELRDAFDLAAKETKTKLGKKAEKWEILATDTKEEKAQKEKHNSRVEKCEKLFNDYLSGGTQNPAKLAEALVQASHSQYLLEEVEDGRAELEASRKTISELEERLEKIKGSGATGKSSTAEHPSSKPDPGRILTDAEAIAQAFPPSQR